MRKPAAASPEELKKGPWTAEEDEKLVEYIRRSGHGSWRALPKLAGLNRCGKSCRLRWTNYLRPDIKRGNFSPQEEHLILKLHSLIGNKWSAIAARLPGRTDNEIKNFWNTHMRKKLLQMGIDPVTHRPRTDLDFLISNLPPPLSHLLPGNLNNANLPTLNTATINPHNLNALKLLLHAAGDPTQLAKINLLHNILQNLTAVAPPQPPLASLHESLPSLSFQGLGTGSGSTADSSGIDPMTNDHPAGFDDNYFHQPATEELIMASINRDNCNGNNGDDHRSDHIELGNYGSGCDHTNTLSTIPALISESPEDSSIAMDQSEKNGACPNGKSNLSCGSVDSFEANWGELLLHDDDAMCHFPYYWKENIIDETSSPSWLMPS